MIRIPVFYYEPNNHQGCKWNGFRMDSVEIIFVFASYLIVMDIKWRSKFKIKSVLNEYEYEANIQWI
jgi:hypothetical protein